MEHGRIHVSVPSYYLMNDCIQMPAGRKRILCVLKGQFKTITENQILKSGDVYEHFKEHEADTLVALESSSVISIESDSIDFTHKKNRDIVRGILSATVAYINDVKDKL